MSAFQVGTDSAGAIFRSLRDIERSCRDQTGVNMSSVRFDLLHFWDISVWVNNGNIFINGLMQVVEMVLTYCMCPAEYVLFDLFGFKGIWNEGFILNIAHHRYFAVGDLSVREMWSHFALNFDVYTHFTSPIRRYAGKDFEC